METPEFAVSPKYWASERAKVRARQIADRIIQLPERLQWEQHRDDIVLVLVAEMLRDGTPASE